uniref:Uncharacterized protein n=1 Tax=Anopheles farauti TaxID=69004 RepID=A0A182Q6B8_9DIPT
MAWSWWPRITDHVHSFSPLWVTAKTFGVHTLSYDQSSYKATPRELLVAFVLTMIRVYFIHLTFTTEAWITIFQSSSVIVERGLDVLLKLPMLLVFVTPWLLLLRKTHILAISYDIKLFDNACYTLWVD